MRAPTITSPASSSSSSHRFHNDGEEAASGSFASPLDVAWIFFEADAAAAAAF